MDTEPLYRSQPTIGESSEASRALSRNTPISSGIGLCRAAGKNPPRMHLNARGPLRDRRTKEGMAEVG
jgi:hypothetical protein